MLGSFLTSVSAGTANLLSYSMLLVVAIFLISGPAITYYYWRKNKQMKAVSASP